MIVPNNNAYKILQKIYNAKEKIGISEARGMTKDIIVERSGFSSSTVNRAIKVLLENGLIAEAIKQVNKNAYYVTEKGIERLKEMRSGK